jgi:2-polyprenyl-3-methyl-5-hydroxy-6-metoxy-1,4-benzoquinol methylase
MTDLLNELLKDRPRWETIAAVAPYYAVFPEPRFLGTPNADARQAFFDSGEDYVDRLLTRISDFTGGVGIRRVLEFGCGPGRLACAFARRGFTVTAVDIAPRMLALARENAAERSVSGIEFQSLEAFLASKATFDLVNATLVLQQIAAGPGDELLQRLLARVAPGGCLHAQIPYRSERGFGSRAVTAVRRQLPPLNRAINRRRQRPAEFPVVVPQVYSLDDVFARIREADTDVRKVELTKENELEVATIVARRRVVESAPAAPVAAASAPEPAAADASFIDVRELMRTISIDDLHRRAEEYFANAPSLDAQLAKPFANPADAPATLINLGVLIRGMHLLQGHTVLDFGAGTGWLSRSLAQMGCSMIVADVSATALRVAREDFERAGMKSARFLHYGGASIDLPDASVDRIICFDAFHHVPNPDTVLREFARILRPGGIAAFSEPGPQHSRSAQSQFEMRTYGVLENDVDIHAIWTSARAFGFADLQLAVYNGTPDTVSLQQYDELLRGGDTLLESAHAMRAFLSNVRVFFLRRAGEERVDSRSAGALACTVTVALRGQPRAGHPIAVHATVVNTGTATWLPGGTSPGGVMLGCHLYSGETLVRFDHHWQSLGTDREIAPGEEITLDFDLPALPPGSHDLELDCVAHEVTWFAQVGSKPARLHLDV